MNNDVDFAEQVISTDLNDPAHGIQAGLEKDYYKALDKQMPKDDIKSAQYWLAKHDYDVSKKQFVLKTETKAAETNATQTKPSETVKAEQSKTSTNSEPKQAKSNTPSLQDYNGQDVLLSEVKDLLVNLSDDSYDQELTQKLIEALPDTTVHITDDLETIPRDIRPIAMSGGAYHKGTSKVYVYTGKSDWYDSLHRVVNHELTHAVTYSILSSNPKQYTHLDYLKDELGNYLMEKGGDGTEDGIITGRVMYMRNGGHHETFSILMAEPAVRELANQVNPNILKDVEKTFNQIIKEKANEPNTSRRGRTDEGVRSNDSRENEQRAEQSVQPVQEKSNGSQDQGRTVEVSSTGEKNTQSKQDQGVVKAKDTPKDGETDTETETQSEFTRDPKGTISNLNVIFLTSPTNPPPQHQPHAQSQSTPSANNRQWVRPSPTFRQHRTSGVWCGVAAYHSDKIV